MLPGPVVQQPGRIHLVGLDPDDDPGRRKDAGEDHDALERLVRPLHHRAVVACQIRLALDSVDDQGLDLPPLRNGELHMRGECGSAHSDDAHASYGVEKGLRVLALPVMAYGEHLALYLVRSDDDRLAGGAVGQSDPCHFRDRTGDRGMYIRTDERARLPDHLAALHDIALGLDQSGRCTEVLRHRHNEGRGHRKNFYRRVLRQLLPVMGMYTTTSEGGNAQHIYLTPPSFHSLCWMNRTIIHHT